MNVDTLLGQLRAARQETLARFAGLEDGALLETRAWRGAQADLRLRLEWLAERDDARRFRIEQTRIHLGSGPSTAEQSLIAGAETRGRLLGSLIGIDDRLFEQVPSPGEWSVRRVLGHVIATDLRYQIGVEYALGRQRGGGSGPLRPPDSALPARTGEAQSTGTMTEVLNRMTDVRDHIIRELSRVPDELLEAPSNWASWDLDVRFRIHRFAAHDREHAIQLRKTLHAIGFEQRESQMLLADATAARAALEAALLCLSPDLVAAAPPEGGPAIVALVNQAVEEERNT